MTDAAKPMGVRLVIQSQRHKIATALVAAIQNVRSLKLVTFDRVRLKLGDFGEHEMPACQIVDIEDTVLVYETLRAKRSWMIEVEVVMKTTEFLVLEQADMWNLCYEVERAIMRNPQLGVPGVIHAKVQGLRTDLHLVEPFYFGVLTVEVLYYQHLTGDC